MFLKSTIIYLQNYQNNTVFGQEKRVIFILSQGKTTLLISHRPKVINCADSIVLLDQGKLKFNGSLENFRSQGGENLDFLSP